MRKKKLKITGPVFPKAVTQSLTARELNKDEVERYQEIMRFGVRRVRRILEWERRTCQYDGSPMLDPSDRLRKIVERAALRILQRYSRRAKVNGVLTDIPSSEWPHALPTNAPSSAHAACDILRGLRDLDTVLSAMEEQLPEQLRERKSPLKHKVNEGLLFAAFIGYQYARLTLDRFEPLARRGLENKQSIDLANKARRNEERDARIRNEFAKKRRKSPRKQLGKIYEELASTFGLTERTIQRIINEEC
ncbi:MAG: hypothetical protein J5J06_06840 [Phycisphaerae bacterium]|nr:hypothetical protein [Phycisphaerae bacterium]